MTSLNFVSKRADKEMIISLKKLPIGAVRLTVLGEQEFQAKMHHFRFEKKKKKKDESVLT